MPVYLVDPLRDPRWASFLQRHPAATVFHAPGWLLALKRTYGYEPVVFTTSSPGEELENGWVFCGIQSWLTGRRLVSLPFSDHCEPLENRENELHDMCSYLVEELRKANWNYIETRPIHSSRQFPADFRESDRFYLHTLDLHPEVDELFRSFHKNSVQRNIRRAEREGLTYEAGRNTSLLRKFYYLQLLTRKRHRLPPQPFVWFQNLIDCMGDQLTIRIASKEGSPVAAVISIRFRDKVVYKYGGSDVRLNRFGGMALLFWKMIQDAKRDGAVKLDFGRSDPENVGLIVFKERWGAARSQVSYWRCPAAAAQTLTKSWKMRVAKRILVCLPDGILPVLGKVLYRHMG